MSEPIFSVLTGKLSLTQIDFDHEGYQAPWRCLRRCPKDIWRN